MAQLPRQLEGAEIVAREPFPDKQARCRYQLPEKGEGRLPVLAEMGRWAKQYPPHTGKPSAELGHRLKGLCKQLA